jgi:hypothetical protein
MATTLREQLSEVEADLEKSRDDIRQAQDVVLRHHEDTHAGVYRYCDNPVCRLVSTFDYDPGIRPFL